MLVVRASVMAAPVVLPVAVGGVLVVGGATTVQGMQVGGKEGLIVKEKEREIAWQISPQVHGGVVVFQGRSHRDWFEVLALNFLGLLSGSKFVIKN